MRSNQILTYTTRCLSAACQQIDMRADSTIVIIIVWKGKKNRKSDAKLEAKIIIIK